MYPHHTLVRQFKKAPTEVSNDSATTKPATVAPFQGA